MDNKERNKLHNEKGVQIIYNFQNARGITEMYHFNSYGCKIGKTALEIKKELQDIQKKKQAKARMKEEKEEKEHLEEKEKKEKKEEKEYFEEKEEKEEKEYFEKKEN